MITLACVKCFLAMRTTGEFNEVDYLIGIKCDWYPDRYPCPSLDCDGCMTLTDAIDSRLLEKLDVYELAPTEIFHALQGLGLPKERSCTVTDIQTAIGDQKITYIDLQPLANTQRAVLHSFTLENGCRIFLGSGPQGATVYRIAKPRSAAKEVLGEG